MPPSIAKPAVACHPVLPDVGKPAMAKAAPKVAVQIPDVSPWSRKIGSAIQVAVLVVWESNKRAAADLQVDAAEFGKWLSGGRRPHFDVLFAHDDLRWPLIQALAKLDAHVEVIQQIRRRDA